MLLFTFAPMKKLLVAILLLAGINATAQKKKDTRWIKGMYLQWGYNTEWYTRSNLHFRMANGDRFTVYKVKAHTREDYDAIFKKPTQISIPQYNYRIGFYLNTKRTKSIELNFDHAKYIVTDGQTARVKGTIGGVQVDADSVLTPTNFFHFEHTDGANFLHLNYVEQHSLKMKKDKSRDLFTYLWKAGAGINIPRTDFTWKGNRFNNDFHIAGYNISVEGALRYYPFRNFFFEGAAKTGYVRYINALANTTTNKGNRASHGFGYFEVLMTVGYDIKF